MWKCKKCGHSYFDITIEYYSEQLKYGEDVPSVCPDKVEYICTECEDSSNHIDKIAYWIEDYNDKENKDSICRKKNKGRMKIKFSGDYVKLHGQTTAELIAVKRIFINEYTPKELLEYDTKKTDGSRYPLPKGEHLQLIFMGNFFIPFCTIRRAFPAKERYYTSNIGKIFEIVKGGMSNNSKI